MGSLCQLFLQSLCFLGEFFELRLQFNVFVPEVRYDLIFFLVIDDEIRNLPFVFRYKKLLRLNLLSKMIFNSFIGVLVEDELAKNFLVLEVLLLVILEQVLFSVQVVFQLLDLFKQLALPGVHIDHLLALDLGRYEGLCVDGVSLSLHELNPPEEHVLLLLKLLHDDGDLDDSIVLHPTADLDSILLPTLVVLSFGILRHLARRRQLLGDCLLVALVDYFLDHFLVDLVSLLQVGNLLVKVFVLSLQVRDLQEELFSLTSSVMGRRVVLRQTRRENIAN